MPNFVLLFLVVIIVRSTLILIVLPKFHSRATRVSISSRRAMSIWYRFLGTLSECILSKLRLPLVVALLHIMSLLYLPIAIAHINTRRPGWSFVKVFIFLGLIPISAVFLTISVSIIHWVLPILPHLQIIFIILKVTNH